MKMNLKLVLGLLVLVIIVAAIGIWLLPGDEIEITGAAVSETPALASNCPIGEDAEILDQCKMWENSGFKSSELEILTDESLDNFCGKIIEMYPGC